MATDMDWIRIERTVNAPIEHVWMMWTTLRCYRNGTDPTAYEFPLRRWMSALAAAGRSARRVAV